MNIGLDGLLYTLGPADKPIGTVVRQYHPVTMELLKTITLPANHRAIAVDANGDIFAANPDIQRYTNDGVPVARRQRPRSRRIVRHRHGRGRTAAGRRHATARSS